ncbi:hypothetical protein [Streptomyces beihaiensis]|uniref:Uncharacterized protein n=1 Tax=Streptomyces beihaiensis TaxID=2984495 RepID=A0ABT3TNE6_9ACTN|nr:hypothetical protein [Streptomyces beihaiensis]MCX3058517.1 hypothetical protein [Streptomyces beihaiensis]
MSTMKRRGKSRRRPGGRLRGLSFAALTLGVAAVVSACGPDSGSRDSAAPAHTSPAATASTAPTTAATSTAAPGLATPSPDARPKPKPKPKPTSESKPKPKPKPAAPTTASRTRTPWPRVAFAGLTFEVPPGWTLARYAEGACLQPVHRAGLPTMFGCAGIVIQSGSSIVGNEMRPYQPHQPGGWYVATDVQPCPVHRTLPDGSTNLVTSGSGAAPIASGLRPVGSHKADYDRWSAACASGYRFSPQAWYLPVSRVLFLDYTGHAQTARVLESVRFPG